MGMPVNVYLRWFYFLEMSCTIYNAVFGSEAKAPAGNIQNVGFISFRDRCSLNARCMKRLKLFRLVNRPVFFVWLGAFMLLLLASGNIRGQQKDLESPFYVMPRSGAQHIDLSGDWLLSPEDTPITNLEALDNNEWFNVAYPTSVQMAHFKAGKLGNPYMHLNALAHEKLEQKVWYYKKTFTIPSDVKGNNILLSFDGIDYFAKVWLNGTVLGIHEGIFGGPIIDVSKKVNYNGPNELIVEVRSANYGHPDFEPRKPGKIVKGWFLTGGSAMEPYFNLGLWRGVRMEVLPDYHLERPFLFTKSIDSSGAHLGFSTEVFTRGNGQQYQLHPFQNKQLIDYHSPLQAPQNIPPDDKLSIEVVLRSDGKIAYRKAFVPPIIKGRCWVEEEMLVPHPRLWFPNGMGEPAYYQAEIILKANGHPVDRVSFDFGIRTIEQVRSAGIRTADRWHNWQFVVNGQKLFVKGVDWMPVDALYDLTADKYDWAVRMAKNAGIQIFRVWGSALLENDAFYAACNRYGIMVWQDFNIANFETPDWPQDVWESQVCQNIFRLRNQPSLAVWCGGNEFNPYSTGNAASVGIVERNIHLFDPTRPFLRASPDGGSIHTYPDMDPAWYKRYNLVPFVAETGMHSITDPQTIRRMVDTNELKDLGGMYNKDFAAAHPEFVQHFAEYSPGRVPRMLSRASHIDNMAHPSLEAIAEASQIGAGEFYQVMSEKVQSNYPVTTGLMPWVYKRPWPVVAAINLVDGNGQPSAPYYFLKRTYESTHVLLDIQRLLWAPGDTFPVSVKVLNAVGRPGFKGKAEVKIYDDKFRLQWQDQRSLAVQPGAAVSTVALDQYVLPAGYKEKFFFVSVSLYNEKDELISSSHYWPRTIKQMEDQDYHDKYIREPLAWPSLPQGPWLKPTVARSTTNMKVELLENTTVSDKKSVLRVRITNTGNLPAFMTHVDVYGIQRAFFATDNYFWMDPGAQKELTIEAWWKAGRRQGDRPVLSVAAWNAKGQKIAL